MALEPLFYQVTPLIPCPGTQLYRRLQEDGRFLPGQDWSFKQYQDDEVMQRKNFAQGELRRFYDLALKKLSFVYIGNMHVPQAADTHCPNCQESLVERNGYGVTITGLKNGRCVACGSQVGIVQ